MYDFAVKTAYDVHKTPVYIELLLTLEGVVACCLCPLSWFMVSTATYYMGFKGCLEMRCYCKILHISCKDHVTNKEVCAKIQQAIGPHEDLLMIVKRCKLQ